MARDYRPLGRALQPLRTAAARFVSGLNRKTLGKRTENAEEFLQAIAARIRARREPWRARGDGRPDPRASSNGPDRELLMHTHASEFQNLIQKLITTLHEELRQHRRYLDLLRRKKDALLREASGERESVLRVERELVTNSVTVERDRIALVTEIGEIIGHATPSRLRLAEIILYADLETRDELLELRDDFRDVADELEDLLAVGPIFALHRKDHVRLYVTPGRTDQPAEKQAGRPVGKTARGAACSSDRDSG